MAINCTQCSQPVSWLKLKQAKVLQTPESGDWVVNLILACPHCSQQYGVAVPAGGLQPVEAGNG